MLRALQIHTYSSVQRPPPACIRCKPCLPFIKTSVSCFYWGACCTWLADGNMLVDHWHRAAAHPRRRRRAHAQNCVQREPSARAARARHSNLPGGGICLNKNLNQRAAACCCCRLSLPDAIGSSRQRAAAAGGARWNTPAGSSVHHPPSICCMSSSCNSCTVTPHATMHLC